MLLFRWAPDNHGNAPSLNDRNKNKRERERQRDEPSRLLLLCLFWGDFSHCLSPPPPSSVTSSNDSACKNHRAESTTSRRCIPAGPVTTSSLAHPSHPVTPSRTDGLLWLLFFFFFWGGGVWLGGLVIRKLKGTRREGPHTHTHTHTHHCSMCSASTHTYSTHLSPCFSYESCEKREREREPPAFRFVQHRGCCRRLILPSHLSRHVSLSVTPAPRSHFCSPLRLKSSILSDFNATSPPESHLSATFEDVL